MYPNLPYPSEVYIPFAIFTAEEVTRIDANIKSLAAGTGFNVGAIPTAAIANNAITGPKINFSSQYNQYSQTLTTAGPSITVAESGTYEIIAYVYSYTGTPSDVTHNLRKGTTIIASRTVYGNFSRSTTMLVRDTLVAGDVLNVTGVAGTTGTAYSTMSIRRVA